MGKIWEDAVLNIINLRNCIIMQKRYMETNKSSENLYIIKPLVEYTYKTSDNLYANLIEMNCHKETIL